MSLYYSMPSEWRFIPRGNEDVTMINESDLDYNGSIDDNEDPADYIRIKSIKAVKLA